MEDPFNRDEYSSRPGTTKVARTSARVGVRATTGATPQNLGTTAARQPSTIMVQSAAGSVWGSAIPGLLMLFTYYEGES